MNQLLLFTLILLIVESGHTNFQCMRDMHIDLNVICLPYCTVISQIFKEQQALLKKNVSPGARALEMNMYPRGGGGGAAPI